MSSVVTGYHRRDDSRMPIELTVCCISPRYEVFTHRGLCKKSVSYDRVSTENPCQSDSRGLFHLSEVTGCTVYGGLSNNALCSAVSSRVFIEAQRL